MEKQTDKYTHAFRHFQGKTNCNYTTTNIHDKQRPNIAKYLLVFQYEITIDAFNIKIKNCTPLKYIVLLMPGY